MPALDPLPALLQTPFYLFYPRSALLASNLGFDVVDVLLALGLCLLTFLPVRAVLNTV
jgi:hypothetical protein